MGIIKDKWVPIAEDLIRKAKEDGLSLVMMVENPGEEAFNAVAVEQGGGGKAPSMDILALVGYLKTDDQAKQRDMAMAIALKTEFQPLLMAVALNALGLAGKKEEEEEVEITVEGKEHPGENNLESMLAELHRQLRDLKD